MSIIGKSSPAATWPTLTWINPVGALEHATTLQTDFDAIHTFRKCRRKDLKLNGTTARKIKEPDAQKMKRDVPRYLFETL